jgi:hypothetical protein
MVDCVECGTKLGFFEGYRHPTMGRKYLLCSNCYDSVYVSLEQWRKFILPYNNFFKNTTPNNGNHFHFIHIPKQVVHG